MRNYRDERKLVTRYELQQQIQRLNERIDQMATQADVDALTQSIAQVQTDLTSATTTIQQELDALAQANPSLDLTALQAAVSPLDAQVQALGSLQPIPTDQPPADAPPADQPPADQPPAQ